MIGLAKRRSLIVTLDAQVPEEAVVEHSVGIGGYTVRGEQAIVPPGPVVPIKAPRGDREVGPAVTDAKRSKIDMPRPAAILGEKSVGRTCIPVADNQLVDRRDDR